MEEANKLLLEAVKALIQDFEHCDVTFVYGSLKKVEKPHDMEKLYDVDKKKARMIKMREVLEEILNSDATQKCLLKQLHAKLPQQLNLFQDGNAE
ncbi:MAG: hypothetical protein MUC49_02140 [Raineya sp.]|jgi:hypothetical protein|nr:hypothetical protein [Raineya sp.]